MKDNLVLFLVWHLVVEGSKGRLLSLPFPNDGAYPGPQDFRLLPPGIC